MWFKNLEAVFWEVTKECNLADRKGLTDTKGQKISLGHLSRLTGFPTHLIKRELLIKDEEVFLEELRTLMLQYLEDCNKEFSKTLVS